MLSSTTRAAIVGIDLPTEPILRTASSLGSAVVTGDISVCPNTDTISVCGNVAAIFSSSATLAGAAPHEIVRNEPLRRVASGCAQSSCHCAGTRNRPVTPSASTTSSVPSASNGAVGMITPRRPSSSSGAIVPIPAMWNSGTLISDTVSLPVNRDVRIAVIDCISRLRWVSIAPFGRPVVPEVYMISATSRSSIATSGSGFGAGDGLLVRVAGLERGDRFGAPMAAAASGARSASVTTSVAPLSRST